MITENEKMMNEYKEYFDKFPEELICSLNPHIIGSTCYISRMQVEKYFNDKTIPAKIDSNPLAFHSPESKSKHENALSSKCKEEAIILALCRCALFNATDATRHQICRLRDLYRSSNNNEMADKIEKMLNPEPNEMDNLKIVKSKSDDAPVGFGLDYDADIMYRASKMFKASAHNEVYLTSDGELWHYKHSVDKRIKDLSNKTVITITRAEIEKYFPNK